MQNSIPTNVNRNESHTFHFSKYYPIRNRLQIDEFLIYILFGIFSVNQFEAHDDAKHNYFSF